MASTSKSSQTPLAYHFWFSEESFEFQLTICKSLFSDFKNVGFHVNGWGNSRVGGFANRHLEPKESNSKVGIWLSCSGHLGRSVTFRGQLSSAVPPGFCSKFAVSTMYWQHINAYQCISAYHIYTCYMHEAYGSTDSPDHFVAFGWVDKWPAETQCGPLRCKWQEDWTRLNGLVMVKTHDTCMLLGQMISKSMTTRSKT